MNKKYSLILLIPLSLLSMVHADNSAKNIKGEVKIIIDEKTYTLPLQKCYSATKTVEGKPRSVFLLATHHSRKSKESGPRPRFSSLGSKTSDNTKASYRLQLDGGVSKGGSEYAGKIPFQSFDDQNLKFEGEARSLKRDSKKILKKTVAIAINAQCF